MLNFDKEIDHILKLELQRQQYHIELIASENFVSLDVLKAQGSVLTNKYAEGYSGKRYYDGCEFIDQIENLAIDRLKKLYNANYVNVQPHSGSGANQAVFLALLNPGDTILGMSLNAGGHLSHGAPVSISGKWFNIVSYNVNSQTHRIDYDEIEKLAITNKPKLIIAGYSAYSRNIDFARFRDIADKIGAYLLADIAHFAGIVAAGYHQNPLPYSHVVTSTTHKTLRGPRGGIIMTNIKDIAKKINSAVFPGLQGGPLMHVIAAKAVSFFEALQPSFKTYIENVLANANTLASRLIERGYDVLTGGTDNHLLVLKLTKVTGKDVADLLNSVGIVCNKNSIPFDTRPPSISSGVRLGSPACTTRGMGTIEFTQIANLIADCIESLESGTTDQVLPRVKSSVKTLCEKFPLPY